MDRTSVPIMAGALLVILSALQPFPCQNPSSMDPPSGSVLLPDAPQSAPDISAILSSLDGFFEENQGQVQNPDVIYYAKGNPLSVGLRTDGVVLVIRRDTGTWQEGTFGLSDDITTYAFNLEYVNCNHVEPLGRNIVETQNHYYKGVDMDSWVANGKSYSEVVYEGLYDDVDLRFSFSDGMMKYEFVLGPHADSSDIVLRYQGVTDLKVDESSGDMVISTMGGSVKDSRPIFLQVLDGRLERFPGDYEMLDDRSWGFRVPKDCKVGHPMVIDPGLVFSTFYSGSNGDAAISIEVDEVGDICVAGLTASADFPTSPGAYKSDSSGIGCHDAFVFKIHPPNLRVFSTYIGGDLHDEGVAVRVLSDGTIWLLGATDGNFLSPGASTYTDPFLVRMDGNGSFMGGFRYSLAYEDFPTSFYVDETGDFIITGITNSPNLICHEGAYCNTYTGDFIPYTGGFVVRGSYHDSAPLFEIEYGTYLNAISNNDFCQRPRLSVDTDPEGNVILAGTTNTQAFPTTSGAFCISYQGGRTDGFVMKFDRTLSRVIDSTFIGGNQTDGLIGLDVGEDGSVYLTGFTNSTDFPLSHDAIFSKSRGLLDAFIMVMDANLSCIDFSTLLGGEGHDTGTDIALDRDSNLLCLLGLACGGSLPCTKGCYDPYIRGETDIYIAVINLTSRRLHYCTYLGGNMVETPAWDGIDYGDDGIVYVCGHTPSNDFPTTPDAGCPSFTGSKDNVYVIALDPTPCDEPKAPANLTATAEDNRVILRWDPPERKGARVFGHRIYRGTSLVDAVLIGELPWKVHNYTDDEVVNGVTFYYSVSAINSAGEGRCNKTWARPLGLPGAPIGLTAQTGDGTVNLTWNPPEDIGGELLGYLVLRGSFSTGLEVWESGIGNRTYFVDLDVKTGKEYYYAVIAYNSIGQGPVSMQVMVIPTSPPSSPTGFTVRPGDRRVGLAWNRPLEDGGSSLTGFRVYRGQSLDNLSFLVQRRSSELSFEDVGLENGRKYYYYVTAITKINESRPTQTLWSIPYGLPHIPINLIAIAGDRCVELHWNQPIVDGGSPVRKYNVYTGNSPGTATFSVVVKNDTIFNHSGLVNGLEYWYMVAAVNDAGEGPRTNPICAIPGRAPGPLNYFDATCVPEGILLAWSAPADWGGLDAITYQLLRGDTGDTLEVLIDLANGESYLDTSVDGGRTYFYSARAVNEFGMGPAASAISVKVKKVPGPVRDLVAKAGDGFVELSWRPPADDGGAQISAYLLYRGLSEVSLIEIARLCDERGYNDTDLRNLHVVYYMIAAINEVGSGMPSNTINTTPMSVPGEPVLFTADVRGDTVILSWGVPYRVGSAPILGYDILRGSSMADMDVVARIGPATSYIDEDVKRGGTYFYRIVANSSMGLGQPSQVIFIDVGQNEVAGHLNAVPMMVLIALILCGVIGGVQWTRGRIRNGHDHRGQSDDNGNGGSIAWPSPERSPGEMSGEPKGYVVERVFVVYRDGRLVMECTRDACRTNEADLTSGMLIAVQGILQDGLELEGTLESIRYGENLILMASGQNVTLAAVVYGHPIDELRADLESTVRLIESSYAGVIDEWVGDLSVLGGIRGMVEQFLSRGGNITREDVGEVPMEPGITLLSAVDFYRGYVRLKIAALNITELLITDSAIQVRYDPDMLRLERVEPSTLRLWGDRVTIGLIKPNERKTVALLFDPQTCQETYIDGTLTYYNIKGQFQHVDMKRRHADVVCPTLFTTEHINTAILKRLLKDELHLSDLRMFRYPERLSGEEMLRLSKEAIGRNDIQIVREYVAGGPPYRAEVWYYSETKPSPSKVVMRIRVDQEHDILEFFVAASSMPPITGLLAEFRRELSRVVSEKHSEIAGIEVERDEDARRELEELPLLLDEDTSKGAEREESQ